MQNSFISRGKLCFLLSFFLGFSQTKAQTLTATNSAPVAGDTLIYQKGIYAAPGPAGSGQFWDHSSLVPNGISYTRIYVQPGTLSSTNFTNSTLGCQAPTGKYFYKTDSTGIVELGAILQIGGLIEPLFDRKVRSFVLKYPFSLNDTASRYTPWLYQQNSAYRYGTTNLLADGSGTLVTPSGNYTNCLRVKRVYSENTRNMYHDSHVMATEFTTSYEWYTPGIHGPVLSIFSKTEKSYDYEGRLQWTKITNWCEIYSDATQTPLGIENNAVDPLQDFNFPNPVSGELSLDLAFVKTPVSKIEIIDLNGKSLIAESISEDKININLSEIPGGIYFIRLYSGNTALGNRKLVISK